MSDLEKLIFVADMVEEGRNYEGVDYLREIYERDFNASFIECLKEETIHLKNKKAEIYRLTLDAYEYYVKGDN
jgi:nicotinate-nucleotide adenylyltransferase